MIHEVIFYGLVGASALVAVSLAATYYAIKWRLGSPHADTLSRGSRWTRKRD